MPVEVQGQVGEQVLNAGTVRTLRMGNQGELIASELSGRHFYQNYSNRLFSCSNTAATAMTLISTATYTGISLYNPVGSNVLVSVEDVEFQPTAVPATNANSTVVLFAYTGVPSAFTTQTAAYPAKFVNGGSYGLTSAGGKATAWTALTLLAIPGTVTVPILRPLVFISGGAAAVGLLPTTKDEVAGSIILEPGTGVGLASVTTAATGFGMFTWVEAPLSVYTG